ncbi:glycosyltransferase family 4 protein [Candidatus Roizmanbacteria bacterium]|nr:glycosyltransferase family 4 protein [Candidatus Roizmanbacteria bacterium]
MNICIAHFRIGLTDGVSLEIEKRSKILTEMGHTVTTIADQSSLGADLSIRYFDYKRQADILDAQNNAFGGSEEIGASYELIEAIAQSIEIKLEQFWTKKKFELLFVHNIFSLPVCIPATIAFYSFLKRHTDVAAVAVHHDFYWDPVRIASFEPKDHYGLALLQTFFPPILPNLKHTVISTWEQNKLLEQRLIPSTVITDTFDFEQPSWEQRPETEAFQTELQLKPEDLVFLIATRIRRRKGIEIGIDFLYEFQKTKHLLMGKRKYNGADITEKSRIVLLLPGEYGEQEKSYVSLLKKHAEELNIDIQFVGDLVGSDKEKEEGSKKYSLWDAYVISDIVLYPSIWEGWGNQFIEAVFAKKPILVFEYAVFQSDIAPVGFQVVSLGKTYTVGENRLANVPQTDLIQAVHETQALLTDQEEYSKVTELNFEIGKKTHNTHIQLKDHLMKIIHSVPVPYVLTR